MRKDWYTWRAKKMRAEYEAGATIEELAEKWQLEKDYVKNIVKQWEDEGKRGKKNNLVSR